MAASRRPRRGGWVSAARLVLLALIGLGGSAVACGSDDPEPAAPSVPDAGPPCEPGTRDCVCIGGSGCKDDLLCIASRCLVTAGEPEPPAPTPPRPRPPAPPDVSIPEPVDAGDAGGPEDAGPTPVETPDASPPPPASPADAGSEALDASADSADAN